MKPKSDAEINTIIDNYIIAIDWLIIIYARTKRCWNRLYFLPDIWRRSERFLRSAEINCSTEILILKIVYRIIRMCFVILLTNICVCMLTEFLLRSISPFNKTTTPAMNATLVCVMVYRKIKYLKLIIFSCMFFFFFFNRT